LITIRQIRSADKDPIRIILEKTSVFTDDEIAVALELIDIVLNNDHQKDYIIYTAVSEDGNVVGYYCIGPTPMTIGTYDLYWIAVKPSAHNKGIGKELLNHAELLIKQRGGRLVVAETSSQPKYENTRKFYISAEYQELSRIQDYYKTGDALVVYGKYVSQHRDSK
jgi:ribosomal protein S18 acetylase RimI-like enzyme